MADVVLNITVPEVWTTKVLDAFNAIAGAELILETRNHISYPNGRWDFRFSGKQPNETDKQFGERVLRELGKAVVNMVDHAEDEVRYKNEVAAIVPPSSDVPTDILI